MIVTLKKERKGAIVTGLEIEPGLERRRLWRHE
jgi:hypothetical protein